MRSFYAKKDGRSEGLYIFSTNWDRDQFCRKTPGVSIITSKHFVFLTSHAATRGGQYTIHDHRQGNGDGKRSGRHF